MKKLLMGITIATLIAGCQSTKTVELVPADLYGKYDLVQFDSKAVQTEQPVTINFDQGVAGKVKVNGKVCNNFMGQAELKNNNLVAGGLASTRMACVNQNLSAMETAFNTMFQEGVKVDLQGTTLKIEGAGHQFVYQKK